MDEFTFELGKGGADAEADSNGLSLLTTCTAFFKPLPHPLRALQLLYCCGVELIALLGIVQQHLHLRHVQQGNPQREPD